MNLGRRRRGHPLKRQGGPRHVTDLFERPAVTDQESRVLQQQIPAGIVVRNGGRVVAPLKRNIGQPEMSERIARHDAKQTLKVGLGCVETLLRHLVQSEVLEGGSIARLELESATELVGGFLGISRRCERDAQSVVQASVPRHRLHNLPQLTHGFLPLPIVHMSNCRLVGFARVGRSSRRHEAGI